MDSRIINGQHMLADSMPIVIKERVIARIGDWHEQAWIYVGDDLHTTQGVNETNCVGHATARMIGEMGADGLTPKELFDHADLIDDFSGDGTTILAGAKAAVELHENIAGYVELSAGAIGPWLMAIGPVTVSLPWYPGFQDANSGVMKPSGHRLHTDLTRHACTILGYHPKRKTCLGHKPMFAINSATWSKRNQMAWLPVPLLHRYLLGKAMGVYTFRQMIRD